VDRPVISLKLATSLDGKIALANGQSKWITGEAARAKGRELRGQYDGIAVGSNTAVTDNPNLTTRIDGESDPVRIIYDSRLRLSPGSNLAKTATEVPVIVFCNSPEKAMVTILKNMGIDVKDIGYSRGLNILESLDYLMSKGVNSVLIEGGGTLAASFLRLGLVDTIHWFRASKIIGGDGRNGIGNLLMSKVAEIPEYERLSQMLLGSDSYEIFKRVI